jgi:hypothetical protein
MRRRRQVSVVSAVGAVLLLFVLAVRSGGHPGIPSDSFLRGILDLTTLRGLLQDAGAWAELKSMARREALWSLATDNAGPEVCPAGTGGRIHTFHFGPDTRISTKIFRLQYAVCRSGDAEYSPRRITARYASLFATQTIPILTDEIGMIVLRAGLLDSRVLEDVTAALAETSLRYLRVTRSADDENVYWLTLADGPPGAPGTKVVLRYKATFDPATETVLIGKP